MQLKSLLAEAETVLDLQKRRAYELQDALIDEFTHDDIIIDAVRLPTDLSEEGFGVHLKFNSVPYWTKGTEFYLRGLLSSYELYRVLDDKGVREGRMEQLGSGFSITTLDRAVHVLCVEIMQLPSDFLTAFLVEHGIGEFKSSFSALQWSEKIAFFKAVVAGKKVIVAKNARGNALAPETDGYDIVFQSVSIGRTVVIYVEK